MPSFPVTSLLGPKAAAVGLNEAEGSPAEAPQLSPELLEVVAQGQGETHPPGGPSVP